MTPPQGGIDGYVADGAIHPLISSVEPDDNRKPLHITVVPMKAEAFAHLQHRLRLIPGPPYWGDHFILNTVGEHRCEPVYEDVCSIGDWDQDRQESATLWLHDSASPRQLDDYLITLKEKRS